MQRLALPRLPQNGRYVRPRHHCHGLGAFSWVLHREAVHVAKYSYFIFLDSTVRGPFLPSYVKVCTRMASLQKTPDTHSLTTCGPPLCRTGCTFPRR